MIFAAWVWTADVIKEIRQAVGENAETMKIVANIENYTAVKKYASPHHTVPLSAVAVCLR